eukprot:TRINITY_DN2335_c0_g1_i10.p1 TRINITY_DN2335_c0_g1~~TRINITY_DN2335_c0_g1_i10.p1  ORF type:complete len:278 (-),score=62.17 TRINITY_DN2335_c0_g1_i10:197-1030(-)
MQLRVHTDIDEKCPERAKLRFPLFEEMMWYVAQSYVETIKKNKGKPIFTLHEDQGVRELAKWLKFYKANKPQTIYSAQYLQDVLDAFVKGNSLPNPKDYEPDEEPDSDENNNDQCIECEGRIESSLWVGCDGCGHWYHAPCIGLSKKELDDLTNSEKDYFCYKCMCVPKKVLGRAAKKDGDQDEGREEEEEDIRENQGNHLSRNRRKIAPENNDHTHQHHNPNHSTNTSTNANNEQRKRKRVTPLALTTVSPSSPTPTNTTPTNTTPEKRPKRIRKF